MQIENNDLHVFMSQVLKMLHIDSDNFMYNLIHQSKYEIILYLWITNLYHKQKTSDEAVQIIYRARNIFFITQNSSLCEYPIPLTA